MRMLVAEPHPMIIRRDPERPLIAIGDIHGHADAFAAMLTFIDGYLDRTYRGQEIDLVYLGDFIDRGPESIRALDIARTGLQRADVHESALMGNHDQFLQIATELNGQTSTKRNWDVWMANGGLEAAAGVDQTAPLPERAAQLREVMGPKICGFVSELKLSFRSGDVFCAHAGVDPMRSVDDQRPDDLVWIRDPFLDDAADEGRSWLPGVTVVHGHTPYAYGMFANRIGVDSGGFSTGVFSAVEIWNGEVRFHILQR